MRPLQLECTEVSERQSRSYVARSERNVVINPIHPDATAIETSLPEPVWWEGRLFEPR